MEDYKQIVKERLLGMYSPSGNEAKVEYKSTKGGQNIFTNFVPAKSMDEYDYFEILKEEGFGNEPVKLVERDKENPEKVISERISYLWKLYPLEKRRKIRTFEI